MNLYITMLDSYHCFVFVFVLIFEGELLTVNPKKDICSVSCRNLKEWNNKATITNYESKICIKLSTNWFTYSVIQAPFSDNTCCQTMKCWQIMQLVFQQYTIAGCQNIHQFLGQLPCCRHSNTQNIASNIIMELWNTKIQLTYTYV